MGYRWLILLALCVVATPSFAQEATVRIAKVKYDGGGDWYGDERALLELIRFARANTLLDLALREDVVSLGEDRLFEYPLLYLVGHGNVEFSGDEVARLRRYLEGGGFLLINDDYGLDPHIRREMKRVFPEQDFTELPYTHPVFSVHFRFPEGLPKIHEHDGKPPQAFGLFSETGRLCVLYLYESDLGDGWNPPDVHNDPPEIRRKALEMGVNILTYALTN